MTIKNLTRWGAYALATASLVALSSCGGAEARRASYLEKGQKYFAEHNYEKARVEFTNAMQIDPNDPPSRYWVGRAAEKLGNPRDAVGQYQAAIEKDPKYSPARAALARLFLMGGLADKATELVETGLAQDPQNAALLTIRGAGKARSGDSTGALADAELAYKNVANDEYTIALLASLYRQSGDADKARAVLETGIKQIPDSEDLRVILADVALGSGHAEQAEAELKKLIEIDPKNLDHRYRLARFYMLQKQPQNAEEALRAAVTALPDKVDAKLALADQVSMTRGAGEAEKVLNDFVTKEPKNYDLKLALAKFYEAHNKADTAQEVYRSTIAAAGDEAAGLAARDRLATLLIQQGKIPEAAKLVDEVIAKNPRDNDALILRGNLSLAKGDTAGAITDLRAVLRDQPNSVPVMRALARAYLQTKEVALAEETLRSAVQANPKDDAVRLELAQVLGQLGKSLEAEPLLVQLTSENPSNIPAMEALFRARAARKDFPGAREIATQLTRARPDLAMGPYFVALIDDAEGKTDAAITGFEQAQHLQPDGVEPLAALVRIELARKQPARALARINSVLEKSPQNGAAWNLKGELLTAQNRYDDALAAFKSATQSAPKWWIPYRSEAVAFMATKRTDDAVQVLKQGLEATDHNASLAAELAALYERLKKPDDAIGVYEAMVTREPKDVAAANNLAMLLVTYRTDKASLDRATDLAQRLTAAEEPNFLDTRGWVELKRGRVQDALPLLKAAAEKLPQSAAIRYHLGVAQLQSGAEDEARKNLEAALATGKPFLGAEDAKAALDKIKRAG